MHKIIICSIILLSIILSACNNNDKNTNNEGDKFLGSWINGNQKLTIIKAKYSEYSIEHTVDNSQAAKNTSEPTLGGYTGLVDGIYFITLKTGNFLKTEKLIIQHKK